MDLSNQVNCPANISMPIANRPLPIPKPFQSSIADVAFLLCIWAAIILGSIRKSPLYALWFDELLAFNLISDLSLPHMLMALGDQVDGGAPLYYIIGWFWAKFFGISET